jgi:hypothetical protein
MPNSAGKANKTKNSDASKAPTVAPAADREQDRGHNTWQRSVLYLQRVAGNRAVAHGIEQGLIGAPGGRHERDADRIAAQALTSQETVPEFFKSRFGLDKSAVQIHTGPAAAESARAIGAKAYTTGQDVVFGEGRYAPGDREGDRLLAHELAHVVQQRSGAEAPAIQRDDEKKDEPKKETKAIPFGKKYKLKKSRFSTYEDYKSQIGLNDVEPPIQAASKFKRNDGGAKAEETGTKVSPEITIENLKAILNPPGKGHDDKLDKTLETYLPEINRAFQVAQLDTVEAQALYLAHAAGETGAFRKLEEKTIQQKKYKGFEGRGPVQVTGEYNYVQTLAYLEKDAEMLKASNNKADQELGVRAQAAVDAIKADPSAAADPKYTFLFSGAYMQMAGGAKRSAKLKGQSPQFPGDSTEDSWVGGSNNASELKAARDRLATAKADLAALNSSGETDKKKLTDANAKVTKESNAVQEWKSTVDRGAIKASTFRKAREVLTPKDVPAKSDANVQTAEGMKSKN